MEEKRVIDGLRLTSEEYKTLSLEASQVKDSVSLAEEEFRYKISLLLFDIFEEINIHKSSWEKCNKLVENFEKNNKYQFHKF